MAGAPPKTKKAGKPAKRPPKKRGRRPGTAGSVQRPLNVASPYPWAVTEALVRHLTDQALRDMIRELLVDEAYRSGADVSQVLVNAELKAGDEGADALSPPGRTDVTWLGDVTTCWQLKAGAASQPSRLKGEVTKPIAAQTLATGGRFILVASGAADGKKGIAARKAALVSDAKRAKLPHKRIEVFNAEVLTTWVNEHPAIASQLRGMPRGFASLSQWSCLPFHRDPWVSSKPLDAKIDQMRHAVAFENPSPVHLHVFGRPGIGKSRFVLQACLEANWSKSVLYAPQWADADIAGMLAAVAQAGGGRLVLVVDEVPPEQVKSLAFHAHAAADRIRVITIGHQESPDGQTIAQIEVEALDGDTMGKLIEAAHPALPTEHVRYVVAFADGYTRLARLAADAVEKNPNVHTADLLHHGDIKQLMDSMLGQDDRRPLHVLAVLSSVGWSGAREDEGKTIAAHLGLDWLDVQARVEQFHRRFGIAPRANDLRYISPAPLGVYLALDAVLSYPEQVRSLYDELSEAGKAAYNERLQAILANPRAKAFGEEELKRFFHWSHFIDATAVDRWMTLSAANPAMAAGLAREALQKAADAERRQLANGARRGLVRGLVRLAAYPEAFHDAALGLAELAAAENETWANNASGEFVARYQLFLSGTAAPYLERLKVIEELLASGREQMLVLAVKALARAGIRHEMGSVDGPQLTGPRPAQWRPKTNREHLECSLAAFALLKQASSLPVPDQALIEATKHMAMLLRDEPVRDAVANVFRAVAEHHPEARESLRREVYDIANNSRRLWKDRDDAAIAWIDALEDELSDKSPRGRLREMVGTPDWERTGASLKPLGTELALNPTVLWSEWAWLTGGDAIGAWDLGGALELADSDHHLLDEMLKLTNTGSDLRIIAGYVRSLARSKPPGWIDDWLDEQEKRPAAALLLFDLTWRLADTSRGAGRIARLASEDRLPQNAVANLAFGPWALGPEVAALRGLIDELFRTPSYRIHLLHMLDNRVQQRPGDLKALEDLALKLIAEPQILLSDSMSQYHWDKLARALLPKHARAIAKTIFATQAKPDGVSFFLEHSEAEDTLDAAIAADPQAVWDELAPYLTPDYPGELFSIGFPHQVLESMPRQSVIDWISLDPTNRAPLVAKMTAKTFADTSLAAAILNRWGDQERVKERFFSAFVSGGWSGEASAHWESLAAYVEEIGKQTKLPGVRRWALASVRELRRMADDDRKREVEERVRGYG